MAETGEFEDDSSVVRKETLAASGATPVEGDAGNTTRMAKETEDTNEVNDAGADDLDMTMYEENQDGDEENGGGKGEEVEETAPAQQLEKHEAAVHPEEIGPSKVDGSSFQHPEEVSMEKEEDNAESLSATQASGVSQIFTLLWKNFLTKLRTPVATFFELFSPLLMMLILAAAYTLSDIRYRSDAMYATINVDIPGPWMNLVQPAYDLLSERFQGRRNLFEFDSEEIQRDMLETTAGLDGSFAERMSRKLLGRVQEVAAAHRVLQADGSDNSTDPDPPQDFTQNYDLLESVQAQVAAFLESPITIPSFETYVGISTAISQAVGVNSLPRVFTDSNFGRQWGNLLTLGTLHLSPRNAVAESFWGYMYESYPLLLEGGIVKLRMHDTENEALQFINANLDERTWALLEFGDCSFEEEDYRFKIRLNYTTIPNTNEIVNYVSIGLNPGYQQYYLSGFLTLQRTVNEFIFSRNQCNEDLSSVWSMPMPTAAYSQNPFFLQVGFLLGLTMVMAFLYPTSRLVKTLVEEKETRMRETLFILGVRGWAHWISWLVTSLLVFLVASGTVTVSLVNTVLRYSDPLYIFAYIGLFSTATIGLCFTLAALFSRAKLAAIMSPVVLFATILPRYIFFGFSRYEATAGMVVASLFPATAFSFGADIVAAYEYSEQGVQSWNVSEGLYSFQTSLNMLFFDTILYLFLGFYFDQVIPRQYGTPKPFYFIFNPGFWCSLFGRQNNSTTSAMSPNGSGSPHVELVDSKAAPPQVFVTDLVKKYKNGSTPAVDHLNLTLHESQITCLLGHNGAGKSTTVSVLTGLFPPTSGECVIYGKSIVHNLQAARQSIGICPQHNILFNSLTVSEHLRFFMRIKGVKPSEAAVQSHAEEIGLGQFLTTRSAALSGGNKRKLSVSIALCADPRFLVLDEPTSSMDPHSRRAVWQLLREKRRGRVTLLTTHFMDEAELLADRIAILKAGKLKCVGSAVFLKERFGLGYNLTVVLEPKQEKQAESSFATFSSQLNGLTDFVQTVIPGTNVVRVSGKEVTYRVPRGSEHLLPVLCDSLVEQDIRERGVGAFGIQDSSLEEIFLQMAEDDINANELISNHDQGQSPAFVHQDEEVAEVTASKDSGEITGESSIEDSSNADSSAKNKIGEGNEMLSAVGQIGLLYWKRFIVQKRDVKGFFFTVLVPVLVIGLVLLVLMISPPFVGPAIEVSPGLYNQIAGETSNTGVTIGAQSSNDYERLRSALSQEFPFMEFLQMENATSLDISKYLLETYNDRAIAPRFGAFSIEDEVDLIIRVNWDDIADIAKQVQSSPLVSFLANDSVRSAVANNYSTSGVVGNSTELDETLQGISCDTEILRQINYFVDILSDISSTMSTSYQQDIRQVAGSVLGGNLTNASLSDFLNIFLGETTVDFISEDAWNFTLSKAISFLTDNDVLNPIVAQFLNSSVTNLLNGTLDVQNWLSNSSAINIGSLRDYLYMILSGGNQERWFSDPSMNATLVEFVEAFCDRISSTDYRLPEVPASIGDIQSFPEGREKYTMAIRTKASILHNSSSPHAVAAFNQAYANFLYGTTCNKDASSYLSSINQPLPLTSLQGVEIQTILSILAAIFLLIPFGYVPGAFIVFLVKERVSKSKHVQLISGVQLTSYWLSSYAWDLSLFGILTFLVMMVFLMYGTESAKVFVGDAESFFATATIIFGYGCSVLPFSYLMARNSKNSGSAQISVIGLLFITGFVAVNAYFIMSSISTTEEVAASLLPLFRMWPGFLLGEGFIMLASAFWEREILFSAKHPFDWDVAGKSIALLYGLAPVYLIILLLLEYSGDGGSGGLLGQLLRSLRASTDQIRLRWYGIKKENGQLLISDTSSMILDEDVKQEKEFVRDTPSLATSAPVLIRDLWKAYPPSVGCNRKQKPRIAVRGLSAAIQRGETFGLLGSNGAGKTTTLGMLTSDIPPTCGKGFVAGHDITGAVPQGVSEARKHIGLCPQVDPLLDLMTGRETLKFFARLRGVQASCIDEVVSDLINKLTLTPHADKTTESYSGGNKRKLSLGIAALVGDGGVLLIDECSSGLDPLARRKTWDLIEDLAQERSAIITTHSMEEAEALCSRVGIMAHGEFVALGSVQHLKTKYLDGYNIALNCKYDTPGHLIDGVISDITNQIVPGSRLQERHGRFLTFDVPRMSDVGLGTCFRRLQNLKESESSPVENYSLTQCSLEQVFIKLVKEANQREFGAVEDSEEPEDV